MRISDSILSTDYLNNLNSTKNKVSDLQNQIATGNKIQQPSDSPSGTSELLKWNSQLDQMTTYSSNIDGGTSFITDTTNAMQSIQNEITGDLTQLTQVNSAAVGSTDLTNYANKIDQSLQTILGLANTQSDGKYVFGGTDFASAPYSLSAGNSSVGVNTDVSGSQLIRTAQNTFQKINMSGSEVFGTIVSQNGNIDPTTTVGATVSDQTNVYDTAGVQYTFKTNYTKTGADQYSMSYDVVDGSGVSVLAQPPAAKTFVFNPATGFLQTVNGQAPAPIQININSKNIYFTFDPTAISEKSGSSSLTSSVNQNSDIFNTLIAVRNNLKAGIKPTSGQIQAITDFNNRLLDNIAKAGNNINQLSNSKDLLTNQQTQLKTMVANVQGVDVAQSIVDLQNQENILQMTYKLAASISKQSLLNYL
ncbi:MAG: flagellar hook-associated protein FlgL [Ignavibacteriaceae bacterium]